MDIILDCDYCEWEGPEIEVINDFCPDCGAKMEDDYGDEIETTE